MNGALDEWLSHRYAKPSTAVRIRQAPHLRKISTTPADIFLFYSQQVFLQMWAQRKIRNISTWWGTCGGTCGGTWWGCKFIFMCFCCSYPPNMVFIRNFQVFSRNITGKGFPKESVLFLRTFEAKDESVWGKVGSRLRERNFTSYWLLKSLHMAREPSVGSCFRHFQSRNGQLITQFLPSLHRIVKICFAQMSPKNGKKHRNWGWKHEIWGLWA